LLAKARSRDARGAAFSARLLVAAGRVDPMTKPKRSLQARRDRAAVQRALEAAESA
jgi:hypothetical protein